MKEYTLLCLEGESTIPQRKIILERKRKELQKNIEALNSSIEYIDKKQNFYDEVLEGKRKYFSNLIPCSCE